MLKLAGVFICKSLVEPEVLLRNLIQVPLRT